jgi:hypothetical protein
MQTPWYVPKPDQEKSTGTCGCCGAEAPVTLVSCRAMLLSPLDKEMSAIICVVWCDDCVQRHAQMPS